ncbi:MAG: hypothetical protein EHM49_00425 [Deltaproteobacteria bacterium]|nr:MAG: hypothetical protein EHM49_00425 [Deltaproteobacteria bacterium]
MRIAGMGDLHLRSSVPVHRKDNYPHVLINKFKYILNFCDEHNIEYLIQPGDFFNSVNTSWDLFRNTALLLSSVKVKLFVVYGQHDLRFHAQDTANTPLRAFEDLKLVTRLTPVAPVIIGKTALWGSSWEEDPPAKLSSKHVNIWATHQTITDNDKLWPGAENYSLAQHLLKKHTFSLIISGDNHKGFISRFADRLLVNCGSLGRTNIDQATHIPFFIVFDTATKKMARVRVPAANPNTVLAVKEVKEIKHKEAELAKLIEGLKSARLQKGYNYKDMTMSILKQMEDTDLIDIMGMIFLAAETTDKNLGKETNSNLVKSLEV